MQTEQGSPINAMSWVEETDPPETVRVSIPEESGVEEPGSGEVRGP